MGKINDPVFTFCKCPACVARKLKLTGGLYGPLEEEKQKPTSKTEPKNQKLFEEKNTATAKASEQQVGGTHYSRFVIQPGEFISKNKLGWFEGNVIKYVCRHPFKNKAEDIKKAIHYLQLILQWEYNEN